MAFTGFSEAGLGFLAQLAEHNDRAWFAENRERYERELLGPEREFVDAVGAAFAHVDPRVQAVPAVNRSIFRINRDTRFSRDKSPYKTHSDMWFWIGADRKSAPGYFVRLVPGAVWVGGGAHSLTDAQVARFRHAVAADATGEPLQRIVDGLVADGFELSEPTLKRAPAGFSADSPRIELLRQTQIHAIVKTSPPPAEMTSAAFVGWCMERFVRMKPLVDWLAENL